MNRATPDPHHSHVDDWLDGWMNRKDHDHHAPPSPQAGEFHFSRPAPQTAQPPNPHPYRASPYPLHRPPRRSQTGHLSEPEEPEPEFHDTQIPAPGYIQRPAPSEDLQHHRINMALLSNLKVVGNSIDENGHSNHWIDKRDSTGRIYESFTTKYYDTQEKGDVTGTFWFIDNKWIRYSYSKTVEQIWNPKTKKVKVIQLKKPFISWYWERAKAHEGNAFSIEHRASAIYGVDRDDWLRKYGRF